MLQPSRRSLPLRAQTLDITCGPACLDSMFHFFEGWSPGEMHFAGELKTLSLGFTPVDDVSRLARELGFLVIDQKEGRVCDLLKAFSTGAVIFVTWWDEDAGHYSLIESISLSEIILMDPWEARLGKYRHLLLEEFVPLWNQRGARSIACTARSS